MAGIIGTKMLDSRRAMRWNGFSFSPPVGGFGFARFADACGTDKGGIDFIDHPGAEDDLHLSGIAKAAFHPVDFANRLLIGERVVDQHQPQAGGAVRGAGDIFLAAQQEAVSGKSVQNP